MGLSIYLLAGCGYQERRESVLLINRTLKEHNLPFYEEPPVSLIQNADLPDIEWLYSTSEGLELLAAKFIEDPNWRLPSDRRNYFPISTKSHQEILQNGQSHIVCLPKGRGYYVPIQLHPPLLNQSPRIGSSLSFQDELKELARRLDFGLEEYISYFSILNEQRRSELEEDPFGAEKWVLVCLYNLTIASIRYESVIVFSG